MWFGWQFKGADSHFYRFDFSGAFCVFCYGHKHRLVVHDKINLQNAVDLAAYYGAQKQAEMLNVIAHQNYQIRQSWKLLTWRYRVLGTMGLQTPPHPVSVDGPLTEIPVFGQRTPPSVCVTYRPTWQEVQGDNLCKVHEVRIPPLPIVPVIAGFNGINAVIRAFTRRLRLQSDRVCDTHGAYNFWFAASILKAFREDQKNRKEVMYALADNLSKSESDFIDIEGHSVRAGVEVTLRKNLTHGNSDGQPQVDFLNSLASVERRDWLSEIRVSPTLLYTDNTTASGCNAAVTPLAAEDINHPRRPGARQMLENLDPTGNLRLFAKDSATLGGDLENPYAYSLGVEKNPWIWAYVGVKAETAPRQLFFPIGPNARMVARAFAKPFGGRIGPWYGQTWPFGSPRSSDGGRGSRPDALLPPRNLPNGSIPNPTDLTRLPNYSRFPGDLHGMNSSLALASLKNMKRVRVWYDFYRQIADTFEHAAPNDIMPWNFNV